MYACIFCEYCTVLHTLESGIDIKRLSEWLMRNLFVVFICILLQRSCILMLYLKKINLESKFEVGDKNV